MNQNPEQIARDNIDRKLKACGWVIQNKSRINLQEGLGVAVREFLTDVGPADYVLFVSGKPAGNWGQTSTIDRNGDGVRP